VGLKPGGAKLVGCEGMGAWSPLPPRIPGTSLKDSSLGRPCEGAWRASRQEQDSQAVGGRVAKRESSFPNRNLS